MTLPAWDRPRTAVVTGAGSGLGTAIAHRLAAEGAQVGVTDVNPDTAVSVASAIVDTGGSAVAVAMDVSHWPSIEAGMNEVRAAFGPIAILINNAGISPFEKFLDIDGDAFDQVMAVNLRGPFQCCQAVVPDMIEAQWGRIVNIASSSAQTGNAR
ncbi:MAG: SDR family NAD(P)-dependent oxidoreductase, partial [bacterium]|nr:SDR family NAD(P)-dependent oxidoreductase [bacterium]